MSESVSMSRAALVDFIYKSGQAGRERWAWAIADALLAAGLRLPSVVCHESPVGETQAPLSITDDTQAPDETLAWAVLDEDGTILFVRQDKAAAEYHCRPANSIARVAIRIVEDEA